MTLQDKHTKIVAATEADTEEILCLYKAQLGQEFCPWDEHYPERENIAFDLERDALFVMKNEKDEIIAAISAAVATVVGGNAVIRGIKRIPKNGGSRRGAWGDAGVQEHTTPFM